MSAFKALKSISFERTSLIFTAGESIKGSLVFDDAERTLKIYDLHILLTGVVRQCTYYRPYVEHKRHLEDYQYKILTTYSTGKITKSDECITIPPRTRMEVDFDINLPSSLWSTFIGTLGYTVYRLIIVGRPNGPSNSKEGLLYHNEIAIIGLVDPIMDGFTSAIDESRIFTTKSGDTAKLKVHMDKTWASPGEDFAFKVLVENGLKLPLAAVKMVFQQNVSYEFKGPGPKITKRQQRDQDVVHLIQKEGPTIPPGPGRTIPWNYTFKIPHIVPTGLGSEGCKLIKVTYCITIILAKFVNLAIMIPIHIGTASAADMDWEDCAMAYGKELKRSLSSQSLAAWGDGDNMGSTWSLIDSEVGTSSSSSASSRPPPPGSDWGFSETPPPRYDEAIDKERFK